MMIKRYFFSCFEIDFVFLCKFITEIFERFYVALYFEPCFLIIYNNDRYKFVKFFFRNFEMIKYSNDGFPRILR